MVKQKQKRTKTYFNGTILGSRRYSFINSGKLRVAIVVELLAGCAVAGTTLATEAVAASDFSSTVVLLVFFFFFFEFLLLTFGNGAFNSLNKQQYLINMN